MRDAGFTVYMPSLFGQRRSAGRNEGAQVFRRARVSAGFRAFAGAPSPVTQWLCALARHAYGECGPRAVGVIGMCFTGNVALTMTLEPAKLTLVLSQPSLQLYKPEGSEI